MIHTVVVAHTQRIGQLPALIDLVHPNWVTIDDGTIGCDNNHQQAWRWHAEHPADWGIVLEDDALPVPDFATQALRTLHVAPEPVVSFYLGQNRPILNSGEPVQRRIARAIDHTLYTRAHWLTAPRLLHAVAIAIQGNLIGELLEHWTPLPVDEAITHWLGQRKPAGRIAYTYPSIIDHDDKAPTLASHHDGQPRTAGRVAWSCGGRDVWTNKTDMIWR